MAHVSRDALSRQRQKVCSIIRHHSPPFVCNRLWMWSLFVNHNVINFWIPGDLHASMSFLTCHQSRPITTPASSPETSVARPTGRSTGRSTSSGTPSRVKACVFGVLGNHDTAHIVPGLEAIGIRMLLKENELMRRGGPRLRNHLYGREARHCYGQ